MTEKLLSRERQLLDGKGNLPPLAVIISSLKNWVARVRLGKRTRARQPPARGDSQAVDEPFFRKSSVARVLWKGRVPIGLPDPECQ